MIPTLRKNRWQSPGTQRSLHLKRSNRLMPLMPGTFVPGTYAGVRKLRS